MSSMLHLASWFDLGVRLTIDQSSGGLGSCAG